MTDNIIALDFNGVKVILDSNTKLKRLTLPVSTATNTTLHDETDSNYQVPTGKKFTLIYVEHLEGGGNVNLVSATAADSSTGAVEMIDASAVGPVDNVIFLLPSIAADRYINLNRTSGDSGTTIWVIFGIEESA